MDFKNDIVIDEFNLDSEWKKQPRLFLQISEEAQKADLSYKKAKENVEVVKAKLYKSIKTEMLEEGEKVTEKALENEILIHDDYHEAFDKMLQRQNEAQLLKAGVLAFEQKKSALENMVKLHIAGYFGEPKHPQMEEDISTESGKKQRKKLNKNKGE